MHDSPNFKHLDRKWIVTPRLHHYRDNLHELYSLMLTISFPELRSPWPAVGKRELWEHPFSNNNGNNRILHIRFYCACAVRSLHVWYLWRMPEMDAPRALVFRPLVKGNEALGTRLWCSYNVLATFRDNLPFLLTLLIHLQRYYSREKLFRVIFLSLFEEL